MAVRHHVDSEITITPPITPDEIEQHGFTDPEAHHVHVHVPPPWEWAIVGRDGGVLDRHPTEAEAREHLSQHRIGRVKRVPDPTAGLGVEIRYLSGDGGDPGAWYGGDDELASQVQEIVDAYRTAPDGTPRTFTGFLDCVAQVDEGDSPYRVAVVDGKALVFDPIVVWPPEAGGDQPAPPAGGQLWDDNTVQFPRLIAEMEAAGFFDAQVPVIAGLLEILTRSMDLEVADVMELVSRAQKWWDEYVEARRQNDSAGQEAGRG